MAASYVQTQGKGTEAALTDTATGVFNEHGWVDKRMVKMPKTIGKQLHLLVNPTDILMLGVGGFVQQICVGPMMEAMSHNLESSSLSVCGIDSFFRKLLQFVSEHLFVGKFNLHDSFTGSDAARVLAGKSHREVQSYKYEASDGGKMEWLKKTKDGDEGRRSSTACHGEAGA
jgi:hypothetical protein